MADMQGLPRRAWRVGNFIEGSGDAHDQDVPDCGCRASRRRCARGIRIHCLSSGASRRPSPAGCCGLAVSAAAPGCQPRRVAHRRRVVPADEPHLVGAGLAGCGGRSERGRASVRGVVRCSTARKYSNRVARRRPSFQTGGRPSTRPPPGIAFPSARRPLEAPCAHDCVPAAEHAGPWRRSGGRLGADPPGFGAGLEEVAGLLCGGSSDARRTARSLDMASRHAPPAPGRRCRAGFQDRVRRS